MERLRQLQEWNRYEYGKNIFIEPEIRHEMIMNRLNDVIGTYKPRVILKAGLGSGRIISDLVKLYRDITFVVVEPSLDVIKAFIDDCGMEVGIRDVSFVNGDFRSFPVDYYAVDMIVSVDNIDIQETAPVIDEFKRALKFDSHLFIAGVVLDDEDMDGVYDEYMKMIFPLHNDYYLKDDLKTFLNLKDFSFIKGKIEHMPYNVDDLIEHVKGLYGRIDFSGSERYISENRDVFERLYGLDGKNFKLPYFTGLFMRRKS